MFAGPLAMNLQKVIATKNICEGWKLSILTKIIPLDDTQGPINI